MLAGIPAGIYRKWGRPGVPANSRPNATEGKEIRGEGMGFQRQRHITEHAGSAQPRPMVITTSAALRPDREHAKVRRKGKAGSGNSRPLSERQRLFGTVVDHG